MTVASVSSAARAAPRRVLLHADDFGMNRAVTEGILLGFRQGLLTGTSLLANAPDARRAIESWRRLQSEAAAGELPSSPARDLLGDQNRTFDLGVHLNLTQGRPLGGKQFPRQLLDRQGRFPGIASWLIMRRRLLRRPSLLRAVHDEWRRQIEYLLSSGICPTHLNGHEYIELVPELGELAIELARDYDISYVRAAVEGVSSSRPRKARLTLRNALAKPYKNRLARRFRDLLRESGLAFAPEYAGCHHAGRVDFELFREMIRTSRAPLLEVALHPALPQASWSTSDLAAMTRDGWSDPLAPLRPSELAWLTSAECLALLASENIRLGRVANTTIPVLPIDSGSYPSPPSPDGPGEISCLPRPRASFPTPVASIRG